MPDDPASIPGATPSNYQRTTGGNLRWKPPTVERLQQLLSGYEVIEMLGAGGMGAVYKARQKSLDRLVAIKILPPEASEEDANFVQRFRNEARTMARMNHPAIVSVYDFGETSEGQLYIVMEFVDGTDVSKMILSQGRLPPEYALAITAHVCDALQYAHTHGVIHRDIKPANILINMEGAVKVADFGLAKAADAGQGGLTKTNMAMGTPDFVAPEALIAGITVDGRADLYAVGVMLYNMLTGSVPRGMFRMPSAMLKTDPRFDQIITKSMEMDREMRYQTAFDIRRDLDVILTTPHVEAGGQSSAAIPKQKLAEKPVSKGPQKPLSQSAKVPVRTSAMVPVRTSARVPVRSPQEDDRSDVSEPAPDHALASAAPKKSSLGPIIGIAATVVIAGGLFFAFKPKPSPDGGAPMPSASSVSTPVKVKPNPDASVSSSVAAPTPKPASVPLPVLPVQQSIDLLALSDPVLDRVTVANSTKKNEWARENGALVYKSDGAAGKIAAPVAFDCRDYEMELVAERLSAGGRIHLDVPLGRGRIVPLVLHAQGRKVINDRIGGVWTGDQPVMHVTVRVSKKGDGSSDRLIIQRKDNGETVADWTGSLDTIWKTGEAHPAFPAQPVPSIYTTKEYAVKTWVLRVFEGGAGILRDGTTATPMVTASPKPSSTVETPQPPASTTTSPPPPPPKFAPDGVNLLALPDVLRGKIEGDWKLENGGLTGSGRTDFSRIAFDVPVPELYDFRVRFTRKSGNLAVAMHCPVQGRDVMWLMGGFSNTVHGLETVKGALGNANPTTVKAGLENGRKYMATVKVRRDRITVMLDGKSVVNYRTDGSDLGVVDKWKYPDPSKLGVGCQRETVFHSIELIPFRGGRETEDDAATPAVIAAPSAPLPAPAAPPDDPRVAQLEAGFKGRFETDAQKPYLAAVAALNQSYVNNGIARARVTAQKSGALNEVTALDEEKARVQNNEPLPPADLDTLPASLKQLRTTYRTALAKIEADRERKAAPLYDIYLGALDAYITELTKANRIDEAQKVKAWRDQIAAQKADLNKDSAAANPAVESAVAAKPAKPAAASRTVTSPAASAGTVVPIPPEVLAPPQKGRYTRELVAWMMKRPAFRLGYIQGNNRRQVTDSKPGEVPNSADIWMIDGGNQALVDPFDAAWLEGQTELEQLLLFQLQKFESPIVLRGMKKLQVIRLQALPTVLDEESMRFFPPLPELKQLTIDGAFGNQGLRVICERCPKLESVTLNQRFTEGGLLPLARLKELRRLSFQSGEVAGADVRALAALPNLEDLHFVRSKINGPFDLSAVVNLSMLTLGSNLMTDSGVESIAALKKLTSLDLGQNAGITDAAIAQLAPLTKLAFLRMSGCRLKDLGGAAMPVFPALELCHLHGNAELSDAACVGLAKQKNLKSLYLSGSALGDVGVQVICENCRNITDLWLDDTKITDAGVPALRRLERIEKLRIGKTAITDASIEHLRKLSGLTEIYISETKISPEGLSLLKKSLPKCEMMER